MALRDYRSGNSYGLYANAHRGKVKKARMSPTASVCTHGFRECDSRRAEPRGHPYDPYDLDIPRAGNYACLWRRDGKSARNQERERLQPKRKFLSIRHTHEELEDVPNLDKGAFIVMGYYYIQDTVWTFHSIDDTLNTMSGDNISVLCAGDFSQFGGGYTFFDLCRLEELH
jgi:hypothetical protein